ncbi:MAG: NUDIX domain-containing protein [Clostridia bacterium]|nr:NUDIX domain-containing protein [Clostridia bacterium]
MNSSARAIIEIDNKYIFIKRENKPNCEYKLFYTVPGGQLEEGETFEEACVREMYEELGINIKINGLFYEEYNEDVKKIEKYFLAEYISGNIGSGTGVEFSNPDEKTYGSYKIELVEKSKIGELNILPKSIKNKLMEIL